MPPIPKPSALVKPTLETKFHIDYSWWERSKDDLRTYLLSHLLPEQREQLTQADGEEQLIDYIDPETAEVRQLDALQVAIQEAAQDPAFINEHTSTIDSVFRVFIANGNTPQTPVELAQRTQRDADVILKTLNGRQIYKGLRPT